MWKRKNRGIITILVVLIMVPVVVISGMMVDIARIKLTASQACEAADSYGDAILSEYDNLLKELYGLFSVTQDDEGLKALETFQNYVKYSYNVKGGGKSVNGASLYESADVMVSYEKVDNATLLNHNVMETQIADFMKFRIVQSMADQTDILDIIDGFSSMDSDMKAVKKRDELSKISVKILEDAKKYYDQLCIIDKYPDFLKKKASELNSYSAKLTEISKSEDYAKYVEAKTRKSEYEAAKAKQQRIEEQKREKEKEDSKKEGEEKKEVVVETLTETEREVIELYEKYINYGKTVEYKINELKAGWTSDTGINFDNAGAHLDTLGTLAGIVESDFADLDSKLSDLEAQLVNCSEEIREGIGKEIEVLKDLRNLKGKFKETYDYLETGKHNTNKNQEFKELYNKILNEELYNVYENMKGGNIQPGDSYWTKDVSFTGWNNFRNNTTGSQLFAELEKLFNDYKDGNANSGKEKIKKSENKKEEMLNKLENDEKTDARDITKELSDELKYGETKVTQTKSFLQYFSDGLSFDAVSGAAVDIMDYFYLVMYDYGMFSSRVSGIKPGDDKTEGSETSEYIDESLTGYELCRKINYLYGAELEYLICGHNKSQDNLNDVRNIICAVRMTMNFASSYTIKEVNDAINAIANAAAAASTVAAPIVKVAVSGALRAAFAAIETVADWNALKDREKVVFIKMKFDELQSKKEIEEFLASNGGEISNKGNSGKKSFEMDYEDYVLVLLFLFTGDDNLLMRTSNLIMLNRNQAVNDGDTLTKLDWKMSNTCTAVKSTVKVGIDFVVIPKSMMNLYLSGTDTETTIRALNDTSFGYSVIRGY